MLNQNDAQIPVIERDGARGSTPAFVVVGFCVFGCILLSVAIVIVLSLIPVYLSRHGSDIINRTAITTTVTSTTVVNSINDRYYVFDFLNSNTGVSQGGGGRVVSATAATFPAAVGSGIAMSVGYLSACGLALPVTRPRANGLTFVISGQFEAGLFQETDARFIMQTINTGQGIVFPVGAVHFVQNLGCEQAVFVAAFDSDDPGEQTMAHVLFREMPADVLEANIGTLNTTSLDDLKRLLPNNPALGIQLCRQRCGLT